MQQWRRPNKPRAMRDAQAHLGDCIEYAPVRVPFRPEREPGLIAWPAAVLLTVIQIGQWLGTALLVGLGLAGFWWGLSTLLQ